MGVLTNLAEILEKPFLSKDKDLVVGSSNLNKNDIDNRLEDHIAIGFYDDGSSYNFLSGSKKQKTIAEQAKLISEYRKLSNIPEVSDAIEEIVDESIFNPQHNDLIRVDFKENFNQSLKTEIPERLAYITNKINLNKNIYSMFRQFYIDGQLNIHINYDENNIEAPLHNISIINPIGLYFNYTKQIWEYEKIDKFDIDYDNNGDKKFSREEIIRVDSGKYSKNLILSNLHTAIKPSNMLTTLEDMLIPMRFSRSTSRRVFNIDVSNLNNAQAEEVMRKAQAKFKYKMFYNLTDGTISNQQHISSLTEDYWFPNRGGEKGTTVDTIDETGNLGELDDILYFKRKLYNSLKVPSSRINDGGGSDSEFDFSSDRISREEMKFFNFISRLRSQFLEIFYELLKRDLIKRGKITEEEWENILPLFSIKFSSENKFYEKMEMDKLESSLSLYSSIEDMAGKFFSYTYVMKNVLKLSDTQIEEMIQEIEKEKKDPKFKSFYEEDD